MLVTFEQLRDATGYTRPGDVARCLKAQGVRVFDGKAGPWTTSDALNQALGVNSGEVAAADRIEF